MMFDKQLMFSEDQAITSSAASTNIIDLSVARNIAAGRPLYLFLIVTEAFTDSGSDSTIAPKLETDDNAAFSSATTVRTYDTLAALTAINTKKMYMLDPVSDAGPYERYIRLYYTVANGDLSTGKIKAGITTEVQDWKAYASGFTVA